MAHAAEASFFDQFVDPEDGKFDMSEHLAGQTGFFPLPIVISDPAVGYGGGLAVGYFHSSKEEELPTEDGDEFQTLPPTVSFVAGAYTKNDSWLAAGGHVASWKDDTMRYTGVVGYGDFDYTKTKIASYSYWPISNLVLGVRLEADFSSGDVPFYDAPFINMRGIPAMRYQGEDVFVSELEGRWDVTLRWSLVGFIGSGLTADSISELNDESGKVAGGGGFRYLIARRYNMRVGLDVAKGPEDTVVYLSVGSSWN